MLVSHPLRLRLVDEMHMRRMPGLSPPVCMMQTVRLIDACDRLRERAYIETMPDLSGDCFTSRPRDAHGVTSSGLEMTWERHSEASTTTLIAAADPSDPFEIKDATAVAWLEAAPGAVIRATKIAVIAKEADAEALLPLIAFRAAELVSVRVGSCRLWSDFRLGADGYGRLLIAAGDQSAADLGRTVQRLQELGNYRNLALLGLPLAQVEGERLAQLEHRLDEITSRIAGASAGIEATLLNELCDLSAKTAAMGTSTGFRISATQAYAHIAQDRLTALNTAEIKGFQSLNDFTDRRMLPAIRTCASFVQRLETLSQRVERTTALLRTRVDLAMQTSNAQLLRSMEANAARQLQLQYLVEGLSVIAISYYAFSLLAKTFPLLEGWVGVGEAQLQAALVIPVFVVILIIVRLRARTLLKQRE